MPARVKVLTVLLLVIACARGREFELRGQVLAVDRDRQELTIKHGDIRGFMPAMTMAYKVKNANLLTGRKAGDLVTATLVVKDNSGYLSAVTTTGYAPPAELPPVRTMDVLDDGDAVPAVTLTDESGHTRSIPDWRGKVLAVTFVYTRCPLPDFCLRMDQNFAAVQRAALADPQLRDRLALLSITLDPQHDTPPVLAEYARHAGADPRMWRFATGEPDAITGFARRFGVAVFRADGDPTSLTHNLRTAVIKPDGTLATMLNGNDWTPAALLDAARHAGG
jgi:protein SCO1/2